MDLNLAGRGFLITGGSKGLGFAAAHALVGEGAQVMISARSPEGVDRATRALGGPPQAHGVCGDLAQPDTAGRLVTAATERLDRLDGALISVGRPAAGSVLEVNDDDWDEAVDSVFMGTIRLVRSLAPVLTDGAVIGMVLSTAVRQPKRRLGISNALRPGLAMTAKALADELGPRGIRVIGLLPGSITSEPSDGLDEPPSDTARKRATRAESIPLGRVGTSEEFGRVAAFMLSPAASFVTGAMIPVDGGSLRAL